LNACVNRASANGRNVSGASENVNGGNVYGRNVSGNANTNTNSADADASVAATKSSAGKTATFAVW
jgi:hypothetical protein